MTVNDMAYLNVLFTMCLVIGSLSRVSGIAYKYDHLYNMMKSVDFAYAVPVMENGGPVKVSVNLDVQRVVTMDESTLEMVADAVLRLRWSDFRLAWNQYMVSSVNHLVWPAPVLHTTWTPDIVVINGPESAFNTSPETTALRFDHLGNVTWYRRLRLRVPCDVTRLDDSSDVTCVVSLASWSHDSQDVELMASHSFPDRDDEGEESVSRYRVTGVSVTKSSKVSSCCSFPFDVINYRITVARR